MIISTDESKTNFVFRFSYNPVLIQAIKDTLRGRKWNQEEKVWTVPLNASSIEQVESFADEWGFALSEDARLAIAMRSINAERREVLSSAIESDYQVQGLARPLMPHQSAAVLYGKQTISKGRGLIIADEPGLGKSASSLALAHEFNAWPMLIVCLSSLKLNWLNEVKMVLPDKSVLVITAASGKNKKLVKTHPNVISPQDYMAVKPYADIVIVNYDIVRDITENPNSQSNFDRYICEPGTLTEYLVENLKHKTIVFDEGHVLSNYKSKQSRAAKKLAARKQIRLLLTGTPVVNKPDDLVTQLSIIGQLDAFGGFDYFRDMYCGKTRDGGVHQVQPDTLVELHNTMRQTCYIRRVKTEVIKSLPEKLYATQIFELDNQRAYSKKFNEFMDDSSLHAHGRGIVEIDSLKELVALGKMKSVVEWIETTFIASKTKLIIFAWHKSVQDELYKSIPNAARLQFDRVRVA
jgi:SWI/SNF-related matrix-associated actin-dependent regulator 1 of chromatin subfamily A